MGGYKWIIFKREINKKVIVRIGKCNFVNIHDLVSWEICPEAKDHIQKESTSVCFKYNHDGCHYTIPIVHGCRHEGGVYLLSEILSKGISLYISEDRPFLDLFSKAAFYDVEDLDSYCWAEINSSIDSKVCKSCASLYGELTFDITPSNGSCSLCDEDTEIHELRSVNCKKKNKARLEKKLFEKYKRINRYYDPHVID